MVFNARHPNITKRVQNGINAIRMQRNDLVHHQRVNALDKTTRRRMIIMYELILKMILKPETNRNSN